MQENPEPEDNINIVELLNEENMLQVDIVELENLNENNDEVQVKSEPMSEPEISDLEEEEEGEIPQREPEPEPVSDDEKKDKNFVIKGVGKRNGRPLRSSPRTRNNPKLYKYDFSDDDD